MQGTTSDKKRGRQRTRRQDNITKWNGLTGDGLLRSVEDRRQCRKIIHEAANPQIDRGRLKVQGTRYPVYCMTSITMVGRRM